MLRLNISRLDLSCIFSLPFVFAVAVMPLAQAQEQAPTTNPTEENNAQTQEEQSGDRSLNQSNSLLSLQGGQKLMKEATQAIDNQQYPTAAEKLQQARQVFNQLSNFYIQLAESFSGIDNRIAEGQRQKALETGQMRDEATYQLALVHRAQNQPELSVPLLIQVVQSQNPTTELGKKAYQQLFEIGFVEDPYSNSNSTSKPTPDRAN